MKIGVPKEIKNHEYRVGIVPNGVQELVKDGHQVIVEKNAGKSIGFEDEDYIEAGAKITNDAKYIFDNADMIVKVKEPQKAEYEMLRPNQILFTYLHLAPDPKQTKGLVDSECIAIAYETITDDNNKLPLLAPMSEVAGRMAIQAGMHSLEKAQGGLGVLLGGVRGVEAGKVVVIGGGFVGENSAEVALGVGADVTLLDRDEQRLKELSKKYPKLKTAISNKETISELIKEADLVVGAVLVAGSKAPKLITKEMLKTMQKGAVLVDVAIDQGGCFETSKPTTHENPTYTIGGVVHYCVANMPGGCAQTATLALTNVTLPFIINIANKGWEKALADDKHLLNGLNVANGNITYKAVADDLGYDFIKPSSLIQN
ncbi:MAG: alanine dehydrogenase [Alphaproteobacteria bacterium]|nr:alanine dehydrogenase [Alphaproteobacteria bacterium]